jgi:transcriptional regulatory protein GAL4
MVAPSVADDFEWNEQESSWANTYGPGIDAAVAGIGGAGGGSADSPQAIMDGMASLSVGERRGYLGAMSGAALLRQILTARRQNEERNEVGGGGGAGTAGGGSGGQGTDEHFETLFQQPPDHSHQHWYRAQSMLTRVAVENLIDAFFTLYHPTFPIVHEPTFRAQYAGTLPRSPDKDRWNTLANIVAALGSFSSSNCTDATDLLIFQAAQKSLFADNLEVGNLTLVQGFGLSATYLQKRNKPNTGYNYGGIALRMAIGLGLHKEFEEGYISPLQMEIRRRVWWTLCILDVGATITYGRPLNWPQSGVEAALPRNIHEEDLVSDSAPYPPEVDGISRYTYLRVQSSYHLKTMGIYNRLIMPPFPRAAELIALDDEHIGSWLAQIPPYYSAYPPAGSLYALGIGITKWRYRNLRIVMYRPFLVKWALTSAPYPYDQQSLGTNSEAMAVFRCLDAAKETIFLIEEYWTSRSHSRLTAWYVL